MCGIGGVFCRGGLGLDHARLLESMKETLAHRGPDGSGVWTDPGAGVGLCHTRLAVLDLSPLGDQPMRDPQGRGAITYNGEVYNFRELRSELEGFGWSFRSRTDTEVVLAACLNWGVPEALDRFVGMFAFAFWNAGERALYLVRDRAGVKPLYYGRAGKDLIFASELKGLCAHPRFERALDPRAVQLYLMLRYVPSPRSIFRDAKKLPAGHYLRLTDGGEKVARYWDPAPSGDEDKPVGPPGPEEGLDSVLTEAVRSRLVSDVPIGAFLSGGVDSCVVAERMKRFLPEPPKTFTVSFTREEYDESPWAALAAGHLGTDHHVLKVESRALMSDLERLAVIYDEPLSDPSALPLVLLSRFARERITVALTGDGGDEMFGGYDRYRFLSGLPGAAGRLPGIFRRALSAFGGSVSPIALGALYHRFFPITGRRPVENFAGKWEKLARLLLQDDRASAYQVSVGVFSAGEASGVLGTSGRVQPPEDFEDCLLEGSRGRIGIRSMMDLDFRTFLAEDVLTKVDRASMSVGLEVRVPLLDHRLVSLARSIPVPHLYEGRRGKAPLRRLARRCLPPDLADRPKMGFTLPIDGWFRGELREFLQDNLLAPNGPLTDLADIGVVRRIVHDHLSGRANLQEKLFTLLTLSLWMGRWTKAA